MAGYISPFAQEFPDMPAIAGVECATMHSGIRYKNRHDLLLATFAPGTTAAGLFTSNQLCGEPIKWGKEILSGGTARGLAVNAGIANVFTGAQGQEVVRKTAATAAELLDCKPDEIHVSSTGIIGEQIPGEKIYAALPQLKSQLKAGDWEAAARAIMTTDTFAKGAMRTAAIGDGKVTLCAIAKGSGMIAPNMATLLCYIFTDAKIPATILQAMLNESVNSTFNSITVDGDMSTSDTLLAFATGQAKHTPVKSLKDAHVQAFRKAVAEIMKDMALLVIKDGEGLSKFVTINVKGAATEDSARVIGLAIANSPLVKTALAASDPNWGRIVAAVGKSGEPSNADKTDLWIGDARVAVNGRKDPEYKEAEAAEHMRGKEINLTVDVAVGDAEATVYTCDLTQEYIRINADYRS